MTRAQRLKRLLSIDASICPTCEGKARVKACIEAQVVINKIQKHLQDIRSIAATA
ncbi:MAG: hypothetical protein GY744_12950 [Gammaproteobacteria bacterium]|nr:hypothetical protein [Gammaproteobacteria bacterium]